MRSPLRSYRPAPITPSTSLSISNCSTASATARRKSPSPAVSSSSASTNLSSVIGPLRLQVEVCCNSTLADRADDHLNHTAALHCGPEKLHHQRGRQRRAGDALEPDPPAYRRGRSDDCRTRRRTNVALGGAVARGSGRRPERSLVGPDHRCSAQEADCPYGHPGGDRGYRCRCQRDCTPASLDGRHPYGTASAPPAPWPA